MVITVKELEEANKEFDKKLESSREWEGKVTVKLPTKAIESDYFWLRDYITGPLEYNLWRQDEKKAASVFSEFYGEFIQRKQILEKRAMDIGQIINSLVQNIMRILYDLREYDRMLEIHDGMKSKNPVDKESATLSAKRVFIDEVDVKKGRGSINQLSQSLEFVTIRDAFFKCKNVDDAKKMDLNDRVRRMLMDRVREYQDWLPKWEKTLRQQKNILLSYLKSQYGSLKLYIQWLEPYLEGVKKLSFDKGLASEKKMIEILNTNLIKIEFFAEKEIFSRQYRIITKGKNVTKGEGVVKKVEKYSPPKEVSTLESRKHLKYGPKARKVIRVVMDFSAKPVIISKGQGGGTYTQAGTLDVTISTHGFDESEWKKFEDLKNKVETKEEELIITAITGGSLKELKEDIEKYIGEYEGEISTKEKKKEKPPMMFTEIYSAFKTNFSFLKPDLKKERSLFPEWKSKDAQLIAKKVSKEDGEKLYKDYKGRHDIPG